MRLRSNIIRIYFSKKSNIKHDLIVDKHLNGLFVLYVECRILAMTIISFEHKDEFLIAFNKFDFYSLFVRIILKKKCVQRANASFFTKFYDNKINRCFLKHLIVVIQILTLHFVVL